MAKKATVTLTDLVIQNPNLSSLKQFEGLKQQLDESANQCLKIKVTDESSLKVCENNLSKFNDLVKAVEDKHKELKKPHWDNCTAIDGAKNYVLNFEVDPIKYLKDEKLAYIAAVEKENKRKKDLEENYVKLREHLEEKYKASSDVDNCDFYLTKLKLGADETKWQEIKPQVDELFKSYITLFELKKKDLTEKEKQLIINKAANGILNAKKAIENQITEIEAGELDQAVEELCVSFRLSVAIEPWVRKTGRTNCCRIVGRCGNRCGRIDVEVHAAFGRKD